MSIFTVNYLTPRRFDQIEGFSNQVSISAITPPSKRYSQVSCTNSDQQNDIRLKELIENINN